MKSDKIARLKPKSIYVLYDCYSNWINTFPTRADAKADQMAGDYIVRFDPHVKAAKK